MSKRRQAFQMDRSHLRLIHAEADDDLSYAPPPWLGVVLAFVIGVLLLPAIWVGAGGWLWLAGGMP